MFIQSGKLALLEKNVDGSTQNQQRIVGRGFCFGRVDPVIAQQRVVDQYLLIWSLKIIKIKNKKFTVQIFREIYFFTAWIFRTTKNDFWITWMSMAP